MNTNRIIGIVILIIGVGLLAYGINASQSVVEQVKETFTGRFTEKTTWYIVGGAIATLVGLFLTVFDGSRSRSRS